MAILYEWNIPADKESFEMLSPQDAKEIWDKFPHYTQTIRYSKDGLKEVVFISKNIADITNAIENKCWEHSRKPHQIDKGWIAYVIPSKSCMDKFPNLAHGVKFKIIGKAHKASRKQESWQSEL